MLLHLENTGHRIELLPVLDFQRLAPEAERFHLLVADEPVAGATLVE